MYFWVCVIIFILLLLTSIILELLERKYDKEIKELDRMEELKRQVLYESLYDGVYKGKLDVSLNMSGASFRYKIHKGELYYIERIENRDGYFAVEVSKDLSIVLDADKVVSYFEKVANEPKVKSAER